MSRPGLGRHPLPVAALLLCLCALTPLAATAQTGTPPISPDRPTESTSPGTVPRLAFQLEGGWKLTRIDDDLLRTEAQELPGLLVRFGLTERVEARFTVSGWTFRDTRSGTFRDSADGFGDVALGLKANFADGRGARPHIGLLVDVSVPVGDPGFTSDYVVPFISVLFENALSDRLTLTYNLGPRIIIVDDSGGSRRTLVNLDYVTSLTAATTQRLSTFIEVFGVLPVNEDRASRHSLDGGLSYLVAGNFAVDARVGVGLSDSAADWFVGLGAALRLPR